jgi:hypothetical protein
MPLFTALVLPGCDATRVLGWPLLFMEVSMPPANAPPLAALGCTDASDAVLECADARRGNEDVKDVR